MTFLAYIPSWWYIKPSMVRVGETRPSPFHFYLPSLAKLWCTFQLRGQIHCPYFSSTLFSFVVHRVVTSAFLRTFSHKGKIWLGWWGWGVHAHPLLSHLPSPVKLQCTLQLSGQIFWPCFISTNICTLWCWPQTTEYTKTGDGHFLAYCYLYTRILPFSSFLWC
jgi:hypothetical protein